MPRARSNSRALIAAFAIAVACGFNPSGGTGMTRECSVDTECNDGQSCTTDVCDSDNRCRWLPDDAECDAGEACQPEMGCLPSVPCGGRGDPECDDGFDCTIDSCVDGFCRFAPDEGCENPDTTPPETTILTGPSDPSDVADATFTFEANEASAFKCKLDASPAEDCTSPKVYTGLANGPHAFEVTATDVAGNVDQTPASKTWTVDVPVVPPPTTCTITCQGLVTNNGQQWYAIEVAGPNLSASFAGKASCTPANGAPIRHGFSGPGSAWPTYAPDGTYTGGGPAPAPDPYNGTEGPYSILVNLQATGFNAAIDGCGYLDLNGMDGVGGRCAVVNNSGVTNCHLSPNGGEVLLH